MRYLWYGFLGLFSLGFVGLIAGVIGVIAIFTYYGYDLPDYRQLKTYEPPIVTRLYAGDGRLMAEFAQERRVFMPIEAIPDRVKNAFIAAEDQNFYHHSGVDLFAIARAVIRNLKIMGSGKRPQGASTITQQVAKNFLLTSEVSYERKIKEAILAYRMERAMSKNHLLELYLNEIYMGARAYGVAAAALRYFDKPLDELTLEEAAYLAALPKAPNNYHPERHYEEAVERRNWVIEQMAQNGYAAESEAEIAKLKPLTTVDSDKGRIVAAPYFAEEVRRFLADKYGEESLYGGGLVVRGTLNPRLQKIAERALHVGLEAYDRRHGYRGPVAHFENVAEWKAKLAELEKPEGLLEDWRLAVVLSSGGSSATLGFEDESEGKIDLAGVKWARKCLDECYALGRTIEAVNQVLKKGDVIIVKPSLNAEDKITGYNLKQIPDIQGALIAMDPHTGRVLAMQGGWQYDVSEFNRATQAKRQTGSAFKPFVYLAALDKGFTPATLVLDAPFAIEDRPGNIWSPSNYSNEYYGPTPIRVGVERSRNLMTVRLADFIGMDTVSDYADRFGITEDLPPLLSQSLGAGESTLLKLTRAYAMLVNGGKEVEPTLIDRIQDRHGQTIFRHDERPCEGCGELLSWQQQAVPYVPDNREQIADPRTAYQTVSMLEGVVKRGTGRSIAQLGIPLAGKTGTTNRSHDAWFMGFSPDLVVGVFTGFDEPRSLGKRETGSSVAAPIFKNFMEKALKDVAPKPFRVPVGIRHVQINAETGTRAKATDEKVIWEAFLHGTEPTDEIYILDGKGIDVMPAIAANPESAAGAAATGTGGIY
ncbi:MAG: penicillin-binding protein 1A [Pseudomonadota bacterium]